MHGFIRIPNWWILQEAGKLTVYERAVLLVLMAHRNGKTGLCCPSLSIIAKEAGISRRQVIRAITDMESNRTITVVHTPNKANRYQVPSFEG